MITISNSGRNNNKGSTGKMLLAFVYILIFPALLLLLAIYCLNGREAFAALYVLTSTAGFFNVLFVYSIYVTANYKNFDRSPAIFAVSALTVFTTVLAWLYTIRSKGGARHFSANDSL